MINKIKQTVFNYATGPVMRTRGLEQSKTSSTKKLR